MPGLWRLDVANSLTMAARRGLALASLDAELREAARAAGVALLGVGAT